VETPPGKDALATSTNAGAEKISQVVAEVHASAIKSEASHESRVTDFVISIRTAAVEVARDQGASEEEATPAAQ
jgi:hypothetical protein